VLSRDRRLSLPAAWAAVRRKRRAAQAQLAALAASMDDERFDPQSIVAAACAEYVRLAGDRRGDEAAGLLPYFGRMQVNALLDIGLRTRADPADVRLSLSSEPVLWIANLRAGLDMDRREAVLGVDVQARAWLARFNYPTARVLSPVLAPLREDGALRGLAVSRRWSCFWVFGLTDHWRFLRFETLNAGRHHLTEPASDEHQQLERLCGDARLELASADGRELQIPLEIARALPREPRAALLDVSTIDPLCASHVIEVTVARLLARWERASEPATAALEGAADQSAIAAC
jgi:hypothetical protein